MRPRLWSFALPFPGDSVSRLTWRIFDAESGRMTVVDAPPLPVAYQVPQVFQEVWWHDSAGTGAYYLEHERGMKVLRLREIDAATGRVRTVAEERGKTLIEANLSLGAKPNVYVTRDCREVIWFSERDGWPHLYLLDGQTGHVLAQITKGEWVVRQLLRVDEKARRVWLDEIYPGPQVNKVPKTFEAGGDHRALVELGFVGIQVDGRGTPFRSKAFHDYSYGRLENGGALEDHVAATKPPREYRITAKPEYPLPR